MFRIDNIYKSYKLDFWKKSHYVLNGFSCSVDEGDICGFLGINGAGKSTTLKILMGLTSVDRGNVEFTKPNYKSRMVRYKNIGFMPEAPYFYPHLTARQFAFYMGKLSRVNSLYLPKRVDELSDRLGIGHAMDKKTVEFSKGMMQKLGLICCLLGDAEFLILDEPLSGLDPIGRNEFKVIFKELNKSGKTLFFTSHILSDIEEICQKVIILNRGKLFYQGEIDKLLASKSTFKYKIVCSCNKNLKSPYIDTFEEHNEGIYSYIVSSDNKDKFIYDIISLKKATIISVNEVYPSLESVITKLSKESA